MDERRTDTKETIRTVALELFGERGYDKTSLREIAERLGVTKAAVYYHFKSKEEILVSLVQEFDGQLGELIEWGRSRPADHDTRRELLRRYSTLLSGRYGRLMRFLQESQTSVREMASGEDMRKRFFELADLLVPADQPLAVRLRARLSLIALHLGTGALEDAVASDDERRDAALQVALELITT